MSHEFRKVLNHHFLTDKLTKYERSLVVAGQLCDLARRSGKNVQRLVIVSGVWWPPPPPPHYYLPQVRVTRGSPSPHFHFSPPQPYPPLSPWRGILTKTWPAAAPSQPASQPCLSLSQHQEEKLDRCRKQCFSTPGSCCYGLWSCFQAKQGFLKESVYNTMMDSDLACSVNVIWMIKIIAVRTEAVI